MQVKVKLNIKRIDLDRFTIDETIEGFPNCEDLTRSFLIERNKILEKAILKTFNIEQLETLKQNIESELKERGQSYDR